MPVDFYYSDIADCFGERASAIMVGKWMEILCRIPEIHQKNDLFVLRNMQRFTELMSAKMIDPACGSAAFRSCQHHMGSDNRCIFGTGAQIAIRVNILFVSVIGDDEDRRRTVAAWGGTVDGTDGIGRLCHIDMLGLCIFGGWCPPACLQYRLQNMFLHGSAAVFLTGISFSDQFQEIHFSILLFLQYITCGHFG